MALCSPFPWTVSSQIPCLAALLAHPCLACPIQRPLACQFHTQLPSALLNVKQGPFLPRHCIHELPRQGHKGSVICFAAQPGSATHRADSTCYITASSSLTGGGGEPVKQATPQAYSAHAHSHLPAKMLHQALLLLASQRLGWQQNAFLQARSDIPTAEAERPVSPSPSRLPAAMVKGSHSNGKDRQPQGPCMYKSSLPSEE